MEQLMPKQIGYRPLLAHAITLVILTTLLCALVIKYLSGLHPLPVVTWGICALYLPPPNG